MNQPATPAITATIVPAASALTMNGNVNSAWTSWIGFQDSPWKSAALIMRVRVTVAVDERRFRLSDDDEPAVGRAQHLDRRAVETAERLARDHRFRRPFDCRAFGDVDDAGEGAEGRVPGVADQEARG